MNNTPTLMDSEEQRAPWNDDPFEGPEQYKIIEVTISQTLSSTQEIQVPIDFDDYDNMNKLSEFVREQVILPSELTLKHSQDCWYVDDFCVSI